MTKDDLISITCRWLDYNHSDYAMQKSNGELYVAGSCQTELRHFLNSVKDNDYYEVLDELYNKYHKDK